MSRSSPATATPISAATISTNACSTTSATSSRRSTASTCGRPRQPRPRLLRAVEDGQEAPVRPPVRHARGGVHRREGRRAAAPEHGGRAGRLRGPDPAAARPDDGVRPAGAGRRPADGRRRSTGSCWSAAAPGRRWSASCSKTGSASRPTGRSTRTCAWPWGRRCRAAIIAGQTVGAVLVDITPHSLGHQVPGVPGRVHSAAERVQVRPDRPPEHPAAGVAGARCSAPSSDSQPTVEIDVYQGESGDVRRNHRVGRFLIEGLARVPAGNQIVVQLDLTLDGMLKVWAREKATGLLKQITVENAMARFAVEERAAAQARLDRMWADPEALAGGAGRAGRAECPPPTAALRARRADARPRPARWPDFKVVVAVPGVAVLPANARETCGCGTSRPPSGRPGRSSSRSS